MNKVHFSSACQNWATPKEVYEELNKEFKMLLLLKIIFVISISLVFVVLVSMVFEDLVNKFLNWIGL